MYLLNRRITGVVNQGV